MHLFIDFWLHWVLAAAHGLSLVSASGGYFSFWCTDFSLQWLLFLQSTGSLLLLSGLPKWQHWDTVAAVCGPWSTWASIVVAHGLSCSTACGIFPDPRSNLCPLHWQADSYPLDH